MEYCKRDKRIVVDPKPEKVVYNVTNEDMDSYLGTYGAEGFPLKFIFTNNDGKLNIDISGQGSFDLEVVERHKFSPKKQGFLEFNPAENKVKFKQVIRVF